MWPSPSMPAAWVPVGQSSQMPTAASPGGLNWNRCRDPRLAADLDRLLAVRAVGLTRVGASRTAEILDEAKRRLGIEERPGAGDRRKGLAEGKFSS